MSTKLMVGIALGVMVLVMFWSGCISCKPMLNKVVLAKNGQARIMIAVASDPIPAETNAAAQLAGYLQKVTGAEFKQVLESEVPPGAAAIYIGQTKYAAAQGIDYAKLDVEEWVIKTVGQNLIISGGRTRGTIYAVFEFLEKQVGIHWFDYATEDIPSKPDLAIAALDIGAKPAFWFRSVYSGISPANNEHRAQFLVSRAKFLVANRINGSGGCGPDWGGCETAGSPSGCHNLHNYMPPSVYYTNHPEYYNLQGGKRVGNNHGGQICFSNPDIPDIFKKQLRVYIANDAKTIGKGERLTPSKFYNITQEDVHPTKFCECDKCMEIWNREGGTNGGNSALLLGFINQIADSITNDYPNLLIETFAYTVALDPPKTIRPRDNIMIQFADYSGDTWRPMTHPHNAKSLAYLEAWSQIARTMSAWDYGITYGVGFQVPASNIRVLAQDIATWHKNRVRRYFLECELANSTSFHSLKNWVVAKLLQDPYQDPEPLISTFLAGYYGPAAPYMDALMRYTEQIIANSDEYIARESGLSMGWKLPYRLKFLSTDYFVKCHGFLDKAEKACKGDERYLRAVRRERLVVDRAALMRRDWLEHEAVPGSRLPFDWERIIQRYHDDRVAEINFWTQQGFAMSGANYLMLTQPGVETEVAGYRLYGKPFPLPEQFKAVPAADIIDVAWPQLANHILRLIADDPAAAGGKACTVAGATQGEKDTSASISIGVGGESTIPAEKARCGLSIAKKDLPDDEAFHWYKIGTIKTFEPGMSISVSGVGSGVNVFLDFLYRPEAKDQTFDVHVSLKTRGLNPEKKTDAKAMMAVDRILFVKTK